MSALIKVSNPVEVKKKGYEIYDRRVLFSNKKNKKYKIKDDNGKYIHFGDLRYEDYTYHKNEKRRASFKNRNRKWENADKFSPAYLSYHLLW